jgi:hypothetical protein
MVAVPGGDEVEVEADGDQEDESKLDALAVQPVRQVHFRKRSRLPEMIRQSAETLVNLKKFLLCFTY